MSLLPCTYTKELLFDFPSCGQTVFWLFVLSACGPNPEESHKHMCKVVFLNITIKL